MKTAKSDSFNKYLTRRLKDKLAYDLKAVTCTNRIEDNADDQGDARSLKSIISKKKKN